MAKKPDAHDVPSRVQAIASDIADLTLRDGTGLQLAIGGSVTGPPVLTRTVEGSSSVSLPVYDPDLALLDSTLLAEKFDCKIDGLWFRYVGASKSGKTFTLTFEDRDVARLREMTGPKKAFRAQTTRAEFVIGLVKEARPKIPTFCPQLHEKQPIKTERQAKAATAESKTNRGPGVGSTQGLTIAGASPSPAQRDLAEMALQIADSHGAPFRVQVALISALTAESNMGIAAPGNVLEALEPYTQIRPAAEEIAGFLSGVPKWTGTTAIGYYHDHPQATFYEIAQAVQKSAFADGSNYAKWGDESREWVEAFGGGTAAELEGGSSGTVTEPFTFEVRKGENYWQAIQRLAKEVSWRAFMVAGRFYFIDEFELLRGRVRLALARERGASLPKNGGIEDIDFDYQQNKPASEITVHAYVNKWGVPPGAVVTLRGYGPASIGPGDAPRRRGVTVGLSSNVKASTHEGKGRYLVTSIEVPLVGDKDARLATVTLRKGTHPLKEPAAATKQVSGGGPRAITASGGENGMGIYAGTAEDVVNEVIDYAHTHGFPAVTRESVRAANATHGPTVSGGRSDHQGPPATAWAADISNGYATPEEDHLAAAIAKAFGIPWDGAGLITHDAQGYRLQLIYRTHQGGDHFTHVHFGCEVK